jgi:hypothetical protein
LEDINPDRLVNNKKASVVLMGEGRDEERRMQKISGANAAERLWKTDLSKVAEIETGLLDQIARKLFKE